MTNLKGLVTLPPSSSGSGISISGILTAVRAFDFEMQPVKSKQSSIDGKKVRREKATLSAMPSKSSKSGQ